MHVIGEARGAAQHDKVAIAFPKTKYGVVTVLFQVVQQRFVEGEILNRGGHGQIEQAK
jgi:hypothetical protein